METIKYMCYHIGSAMWDLFFEFFYFPFICTSAMRECQIIKINKKRTCDIARAPMQQQIYRMVILHCIVCYATPCTNKLTIINNNNIDLVTFMWVWFSKGILPQLSISKLFNYSIAPLSNHC